MEIKIIPKIVISAVVRRSDGTIEDLGVISQVNNEIETKNERVNE